MFIANPMYPSIVLRLIKLLKLTTPYLPTDALKNSINSKHIPLNENFSEIVTFPYWILLYNYQLNWPSLTEIIPNLLIINMDSSEGIPIKLQPYFI